MTSIASNEPDDPSTFNSTTLPLHPIMLPQPDLHQPKNGHSRRTWLTSKFQYRTPAKIFKLLSNYEISYKRDEDIKHLRDRSLGCALYLVSARISEILRLTVEQVVEYNKDFIYVENMEIEKRKIPFKDAAVTAYFKQAAIGMNKRDRKNLLFELRKNYAHTHEIPIVSLPCPRVGDLAPFTKTFEEYLTCLPHPKEGEEPPKIYPYSRIWGWKVIRDITSTPRSIEAELAGEVDKKTGLPKVRDGVYPHALRGFSLSYQISLLRSDLMVARDRGVVSAQTISHYYTQQFTDHINEYYRKI